MTYFKSEESVFNMAIAYLKRIDTLLYLCQEAAQMNDINRWAEYLRGVYREVSVKLKENEMKEIEGDPSVPINLKTLTDNNIENKEATFVNIYSLTNNLEYKRQYKKVILFLLDKLEIKIRKKLQEKGMLLPNKDDPRWAVLQR